MYIGNMRKDVDEGRRQRDTALAFSLICLLCYWWTGRPWLLWVLFGLLVAGMCVPKLYAWPARIWFGLSEIVGKVASLVLLSLVFFLVVTPVGWIRRLFGYDPMRKRGYRAGQGSAFVHREKTFTGADLDNIF